jgi:hypothetical protein
MSSYVGNNPSAVPLNELQIAEAVDSRYANVTGDTFTGQAQFVSGTFGLPGIAFSGDPDTGMWSPGSNTIAWSTNGAERLRIDASGNVGIGTEAPNAKLVVRGGHSTTTLRLRAINAGLGDSSLCLWASEPGVSYKGSGIGRNVNGHPFYGRIDSDQGQAYLQFDTTDGFIINTGTGNATERMRIDASGNVGIGTSAPSTKLEVSGETVTVSLPGASASTFRGMAFASDTTEVASLRTASLTGETRLTSGFVGFGGFTTFHTNGTERARIDSAGALLVNTTTNPGTTARFVVSGNSDGAFNPMTVVQEASGSTSRTSILFYRNSASASVGSITTTTTATAYNTSSDYRLKDNPTDLTGSGTFIDALRPREWTWKINGERGVGLVAHEAQEVTPSSVTGEKDGEEMQAVAYGSSEIIANMLAELKSLRARVAALEGAS